MLWYCRLPLASAAKLKWYADADVNKLTLQHVKEKHMLLDTITALKKVGGRQSYHHAVLGPLHLAA